MLKVEHSSDYLKDEGRDSQAVELLKKKQQSKRSLQPKSRLRRQYNPDDINIAKLFLAIREHKTGNPQLDKINEIKVLLIQIQNINDIDFNDNGNTPLHVAVSKEHEDIVKLLLEKGAKVDIKNNEGKIPLELAKDQEIINMLKAGSSPGRNSNIQPEDSFDVYSRLNQVKFDSDDSDNPGVWAGMDQINSYINNQAIKTSANGGELAYYIGPNNFGFDSTEGIKDIAKHICRRDGISNSFYGDKSSLDKPFIVISNTATVLAQSSTDVNQQGGTHWIS